ncbi:glutaredoxin family protein [Moraxella atlantae]|uniref:Glutaredoxin-like domain (DUF836) n=1 Tax=Faucicola atlantae TaxID=34059 RepID=A0A378Q5T0_9GAMM|nr:glutaredoxin family protein [Moraxella atlantae]OPH36906.1 hypothetical protein B5J92_02395 [Moraxella atlantae]STY94547.1 Glutaredoxin-like domain (DUF836) [Moraxella atlantae]
MPNQTHQRPVIPVKLATLIPQPTDGVWQLYGTLGCHLCDEAAQLLRYAQAVTRFDWRVLDIADLPDAQMLALADKIPVLATPRGILCYPFTLPEIVQHAGG